MSIRFESANSEYISRNSDLLNYNSNFTFMGWYYLVSDTNTFQDFFNIWGNSSNVDAMQTAVDGTTLNSYTSNNAGGPLVEDTDNDGALSVGTWYHLALVRNGDTLTIYKDGSSAVSSTVSITSRTATAGMAVAAWTANADYANMRVAYMRAWSTNLTEAEIQTEMYSATAVKTASLYADWRTPSGSTRVNDFSGNGRHWTASGTLSDEADPALTTYSRGNYAALPTTDADLETIYSSTDITDVASDNAVRVSQTASGEYAIHQFKNSVGVKTTATITWNGQTDLAPTSSTVYLQIYNRNSTSWETIDSDNLTGANTDFTLTADVTVANYKDSNALICCRVYQQAV